MDDTIREAERLAAADPSIENHATLAIARQRAGYVRRYVSCKRCNPETRCEKSHGQAVLCGECGGQGWTDIVWVLEV